jgi:hypothetical protein
LIVKKRVRLEEISFARSGDKGDTCSAGLIAKTSRAYKTLVDEVTPEKIKRHFGSMVKGNVELYPMPAVECLHVVLRNALGGGSTKTLRYDQTGKAMGQALLRMEVEVADDVLTEARQTMERIYDKYGKAWG